MDLRQLRYLVALADELSFTRAAAKVLVAQPALSQQIAKLEAEVGLPLVDRTTRRVALTEAGDRLVEHARRVLKQVDVAREELADLAGVRGGRLTIGTTQTVGSLDLSGLLGEFHRRHPGVDLSLREDLSVNLARLLHADELDLAFITLPEGPPVAGLELRRLSSEPLVAVLPRGHRLAARRTLRVADLDGETVVTFPEGATIRRRLVEAAARSGVEPRIAFETNDVARMRALVAAGLAVAVLPRSDAAAEPAPAIATVPFDEPGFGHSVFLSSRAGRHLSPAARAFMELTLAPGRGAAVAPTSSMAAPSRSAASSSSRAPWPASVSAMRAG
jgi:LysR family transcriptional regulator, transcription activator of glutamate synthase operon